MDVLLLVVCLLIALVTFARLGYELAVDHSWRDRAQIDRDRAALDAEWQTLDYTRHVRSMFLAARRAMQDEARRQYRYNAGSDGNNQ